MFSSFIFIPTFPYTVHPLASHFSSQLLISYLCYGFWSPTFQIFNSASTKYLQWISTCTSAFTFTLHSSSSPVSCLENTSPSVSWNSFLYLFSSERFLALPEPVAIKYPKMESSNNLGVLFMCCFHFIQDHSPVLHVVQYLSKIWPLVEESMKGKEI